MRESRLVRARIRTIEPNFETSWKRVRDFLTSAAKEPPHAHIRDLGTYLALSADQRTAIRHDLVSFGVLQTDGYFTQRGLQLLASPAGEWNFRLRQLATDAFAPVLALAPATRKEVEHWLIESPSGPRVKRDDARRTFRFMVTAFEALGLDLPPVWTDKNHVPAVDLRAHRARSAVKAAASPQDDSLVAAEDAIINIVRATLDDLQVNRTHRDLNGSINHAEAALRRLRALHAAVDGGERAVT